MKGTAGFVRAMRLRTLPLAIAVAIVGWYCAAALCTVSAAQGFWAALSIVSLQVLSNFANEYGDFVSGLDGENRKGPKRTVGKDGIAPHVMKRAIIVMVVVSALCGVVCISISREILSAPWFLFAFLLFLSIWAAIAYTVGKNPYGYRGYGDVFVFIFFGALGVCGTTALFCFPAIALSILPAVCIGSYSVGVLHLNNMRDREGDTLSGKQTVAIGLGVRGSKLYFLFLNLLAIVSFLYFLWKYELVYSFSSLGVFFLALVSGILVRYVWVTQDPPALDGTLKFQALIALFSCFLWMVLLSSA